AGVHVSVSAREDKDWTSAEAVLGIPPQAPAQNVGSPRKRVRRAQCRITRAGLNDRDDSAGAVINDWAVERKVIICIVRLIRRDHNFALSACVGSASGDLCR